MAGARFCSECGKRLKIKRTSILLPFRSFCRECSPRYHRIRLALIAAPVICAAIGFAFGHYTRASEPFYLIGTPVDLGANGIQPSNSGSGDHSSGGNVTLGETKPPATPSIAGTLCGAQTKSGRSCRRRVKNGGYCWQHRVGLTTAK